MLKKKFHFSNILFHIAKVDDIRAAGEGIHRRYRHHLRLIREKGVESEYHRIQVHQDHPQEVAAVATLHHPDRRLQTGNANVKLPK